MDGRYGNARLREGEFLESKLIQKTYVYLTTENAENTKGLACARGSFRK